MKQYIGLDISSSIIGIAIIDENKDVLYSSAINISKIDGLIDKTDKVKEEFLKLSFLYKPELIFVEECAKMFGGGATTANTLMALARINATISFIAHEAFNTKIIDINVRSARAKLGIKIDQKDKTKTTKEKVREIFTKMYPDKAEKCVTKHIAKVGKHKGCEVIDKESEDRLDALIIALAGIKIYS